MSRNGTKKKTEEVSGVLKVGKSTMWVTVKITLENGLGDNPDKDMGEADPVEAAIVLLKQARDP